MRESTRLNAFSYRKNGQKFTGKRESRDPARVERFCQNILIPQSNFLRSTYSWTFFKFASSFQLDCNANFYRCRSKLNSVSYLQKKLSSADPVWSKGEQNKLAFSRFGSTTSLSVRSVSVNNQPLLNGTEE